jgi:uncharacterized protein
MDYPGLLLAAVALAAARWVYPGHAGYAVMCLALMVGLPAAYIRLRGRLFGDYLIRPGDVGLGLKVSAALLLAAVPVMYYGSTLADFQRYYPTWESASESWGGLAAYEAYTLAIMVSTEFFYRGFLMNLLLAQSRRGNAVHAVIYMLAHVGKPPLEVAYSLPVGWLFGRIDLRCGSILPSLTMHYLSSVAFDLMILYQRGLLPF